MNTEFFLSPSPDIMHLMLYISLLISSFAQVISEGIYDSAIFQ